MQGIFFTVHISGNAIIYASGAKLETSEVKFEKIEGYTEKKKMNDYPTPWWALQ